MVETNTGPTARANTGMRDFTQGSVAAHLIAFAWPMLVGNLLQAFYNTVDSFWVGRFLGPNALAAVSVSFPILFALIALIMGLTMATTTLVAQFKGAGDMPAVRRTIANTVKLLTGLGLLASVAGFVLRDRVLRLIRTPEAIMAPASSYLGIILIGLVFMFMYNVGSAVLRGLGDSRTPLRFLTFATVLNIVLDPIMIFGWGFVPPMGIAGAAWATVIAQGLASVLVLRHLYRVTGLLGFEGRFWSLDPRLTRLTFVIGLPAGAQQFIASLGLLTLTSIINRFGGTVVAAFGAAARLDQFATMPAMSTGMAVSALVGQNLGAGKDERVREIVLRAVGLTVAITSFGTVLALLAPRALLGIFTTDAAVLAAGVRYLRIVGWSYVPLGLLFVFTGVLRGAGDTVPPMIVTLTTLWLVRVPMASWLSSLPRLGTSGVWLAQVTAPVIGFLASFAYYRTGRWKAKVVARRAAAGARPRIAADLATGTEAPEP